MWKNEAMSLDGMIRESAYPDGLYCCVRCGNSTEDHERDICNLLLAGLRDLVVQHGRIHVTEGYTA